MRIINPNRYDLQYKSDALSLEFISQGPKGRITKVIQFNKIVGQYELYNLAFGDLNSDNNAIDDTSISNNKDVEKILATVATAVMIFLKINPNAHIFVRGSTPARMRLYMIKISKYLPKILPEFELWGSLDNHTWESYSLNKPYLSLLIRKKINNLELELR